MVVHTKQIFFLLSLCVFVHIAGLRVYADYVLPYPSFMPGNKLYKISRFVDTNEKYWYWGSLASLKYHLKLSDKYLIEAKTLFEYKQYLLGVDALIRSDREFQQLPNLIAKAKREQKDINKFKTLIIEAAKKHGNIISSFSNDLPGQFTWAPEKASPVTLQLHDIAGASLRVRSDIVSLLSK